jgi:hypothetical protein
MMMDDKGPEQPRGTGTITILARLVVSAGEDFLAQSV